MAASVQLVVDIAVWVIAEPRAARREKVVDPSGAFRAALSGGRQVAGDERMVVEARCFHGGKMGPPLVVGALGVDLAVRPSPRRDVAAVARVVAGAIDALTTVQAGRSGVATMIGMLRKTPPLRKRKAGATCPALPLRPPQASAQVAATHRPCVAEHGPSNLKVRHPRTFRSLG